MHNIPILLLRILLLILLRLIIALIAGYREKKQLAVIAAVSAVSQTLLSIALDRLGYGLGAGAVYAFLTVIAAATEIIIYGFVLNKIAADPLKDSTADSLVFIYSLVSNAASFFVGLYLAFELPLIF